MQIFFISMVLNPCYDLKKLCSIEYNSLNCVFFQNNIIQHKFDIVN